MPQLLNDCQQIGECERSWQESNLQICPLCALCVASDPVTCVGDSVIPSDDTGSLPGCDGWPCNTDGLLLNCRGFRGLGELLYWLPSEGGERAFVLESLALDDMGLEGSAVRRFPVSSLSTCMAVESSCLLSAMMATLSHFPPKVPSRSDVESVSWSRRLCSEAASGCVPDHW